MPFVFDGPRTLEYLVFKKGEVLYSAGDIFRALGYKQTTHSVIASAIEEDKLDEDEIQIITQTTQHYGGGRPGPRIPPGGIQEAIFLTESGVHAFVARCNLPAANDYRRWLRKTVMPSLRNSY